MPIRCLTYLLAFFALAPLQAQDWIKQHPNVPFLGQLYDVEVNAAGFGFALGEGGTLLRTTNAGADWEDISPTESYNLAEVTLLGDGADATALILSTSNLLLRSDDGGDQWTEVSLGIGGFGTPLAFSAPTPEVVFALGRGALARSTDAGATWSEIALPFDSTWHSLDFISPDTGWIGTETGQTIRTTDGGENWELVNDAFVDPVVLDFVDGLNGFAAMKRQFCRTSNGGTTWDVLLPTAFGSNINELEVVDTNRIVACQGNRTYASNDGGESMSTVFPVPYSFVFEGICALPDERVWVAGSYGTIAFSTDEGFTYLDQLPANKGRIRWIRFADLNLGWAGGGNDIFLRTMDGGATWEDLSATAPPGGNHWDGLVHGDNELWLTIGSTILRSTDLGETWESSQPGATSFRLAQSPSYVFTAGNNGKVYRTADGGANWSALDTPLEPTGLSTIWFLNDNIGFIGAAGGLMAKTTDGGETWAELDIPTNGAPNAIFFTDDQNGWLTITGSTTEIWRTLNGGDSWQSVGLPVGTIWQAIALSDDGNGTLAGGNTATRAVLTTTDGGETWTEAFEPEQPINTLAQQTDGSTIRTWIGGTAGYIARKETVMTASEQLTQTLPLKIFPNPASAQLQISLPQGLSPAARLTVHNVQGQVISDQVNPSATMRVSHWPPGTYNLLLRDGDQVYSALVSKLKN